MLIGICVYNMALFIGAKVFYVLKNRYLPPFSFPLSLSVLVCVCVFRQDISNPRTLQLAPAKMGCDDGGREANVSRDDDG